MMAARWAGAVADPNYNLNNCTCYLLHLHDSQSQAFRLEMNYRGLVQAALAVLRSLQLPQDRLTLPHPQRKFRSGMWNKIFRNVVRNSMLKYLLNLLVILTQKKTNLPHGLLQEYVKHLDNLRVLFRHRNHRNLKTYFDDVIMRALSSMILFCTDKNT